MPDEPDELVAAVARAEDAFNGLLGAPEYEDGLDPDDHDSDVIQLRKACRLLDACRLLREHNGYHTSVIEMAFATIERTLEFYALTASNDSIAACLHGLSPPAARASRPVPEPEEETEAEARESRQEQDPDGEEEPQRGIVELADDGCFGY